MSATDDFLPPPPSIPEAVEFSPSANTIACRNAIRINATEKKATDRKENIYYVVEINNVVKLSARFSSIHEHRKKVKKEFGHVLFVPEMPPKTLFCNL